MGGYRYVVFGAGRQGTAAVHDLAQNCEAREVRVVEPDRARAKAAAARLKKLLGKRASTLRFASSARAEELRGADVVLSCAPYSANVALTRAALAAGTAFCDLGGNPQTVADQEKLAAKKKVPVVPDCGVSPGLSNIFAVHCVRAHGADEVHVRCGGLPLVRPEREANPLQYKLLFSPWGLISEYSGPVPVIRDGKMTTVPALSLTEEFDAEHESSPTSNNSPQVVEYLRSAGVREYDYMTVRYKGHWDQVRGWKSLGFLRGDEARDTELAQALENDAVLRYDIGTDRDKLILSVRASRGAVRGTRGSGGGVRWWRGGARGSREGNRMQRGFEYRLDVAADRRTQFTAMELTTCWGITIVAHHMASGRGAPDGFATPERFVDTGWVIGEVERRLAQVR